MKLWLLHSGYQQVTNACRQAAGHIAKRADNICYPHIQHIQGEGKN